MFKKFTGAVGVTTLRLTVLETFVLGAVLAAAEGVQLNLSMSQHVHDALTMAVVLLGAVVHPLTPSQFLSKIPMQIQAIAQAALAAIVILQSGWDVGSVGRTVIGVVLIAATTLGLGPIALTLSSPHTVIRLRR